MESNDNVRLKERTKQGCARKKRRTDSGSPMKRRNQKRKEKEHQDFVGSLKFYTKSEEDKLQIFNKIDQCKLMMSEKISDVNNTQFLNNIMDFFINSHKVGNSETDATKDTPEIFYSQYLLADRNETEEDHFLTSKSALRNMCAAILHHHIECKTLLDVERTERFGHVGKITFACQSGHELKIDTSPHIEGGKFLGNMQIMHALYTSGLRFSQYERFCDGAMLGKCPETLFINTHDMYCDATEVLTKESITEARQEEEISSIQEAEENGIEYGGINIITDARHSTRRNAKQSDIIALGNKTHRVVGAVTVTKDDDSISQCHELYGVKKLYKDFEDYGLTINIHGHDRNASVNKYLRTSRPNVENANDTWHAAKGVAKQLKTVTHGPMKQHGITWHEELKDKAASIKTHVFYAMKTCNGSADTLKNNLDNIVEHYKNNHNNCQPESRCRRDENYIPTKVILKDSAAIFILIRAIHSLQVYKTPHDFVHCIDTHYVESYNNACLIYHDKRISFGKQEYKRRSNMAILNWNENVDRDFSSVSLVEDVRNPRRQTGKKVLKPKTCNFVKLLWNKIMDVIYMVNTD